MKAMEHTAHTTPRYTDVMFDYCGVLIDWRPRRTIEGLYPAGVVDMFFDPADPHGVAYYDDLADLGWSEERIIADYEREHGPAVAWIMRHPARIQTIVGSTNAQRVRDVCKASDICLTRDQWYEMYLAAGKKLP